MFANCREIEAYTQEGRLLRVPELGSWVAFDCTACGFHNELPISGSILNCEGEGCDAYAPIPAAWYADVPRA